MSNPIEPGIQGKPKPRRNQTMAHASDLKARQAAPLHTSTDLPSEAMRDIAGALTALLADTFALYLKTNTHSGRS